MYEFQVYDKLFDLLQEIDSPRLVLLISSFLSTHPQGLLAVARLAERNVRISLLATFDRKLFAHVADKVLVQYFVCVSVLLNLFITA